MRGSKSSVDQAVSLYCCNSNLTILLGERQSLHIARRIFNNGTRLLLAKDMACHCGRVARHTPSYYDIMWLDRRDGEKPVCDVTPELPSNVTLSKGDWAGMISFKGKTSFETAVNVLPRGYDILQRRRVVITERLHGHILSILLDIPHVLLDNSDHKLSSYYNTWTRGLGKCRLADNAKDAARLAVELLDEYGDSLPARLRAVDIGEVKLEN